MHRLFAHVIHVSIPDLNNKINNVTNHTYKRINYILNEISKEELQDYIYKQDSIRAKSTELLNIWQLFQVVGIDFFNNLMTIANDWDSKKNDFQNIYNIISENYTFCKYCNEQFAKISITYSQMVPYITNDYYERSTKYKKQKKVNDGSCGGNSPYVMC